MTKFSNSRQFVLALAAGLIAGGLGISQASAAVAYSAAHAAVQASIEAVSNAASPAPRVVIDSSCTRITTPTVHASKSYLEDKNPDASFGTTFMVMCQIILPAPAESAPPSTRVTELASR